jgi:hypothetical protein
MEPGLMTIPTKTVTSTADLTPAGVLGYAKTIAGLVALVLGAIAEFLPEDWTKPVQAVIAVCGVIAVYALPNQVRAEAVVDIDDEPGKHATPEA